MAWDYESGSFFHRRVFAGRENNFQSRASCARKSCLKIINREYTDDEQKISDILNEYVAPAVENDGGKISLIEYDQENKTARMLLQGACSGCPTSSTITLKKRYPKYSETVRPELVENVEAVNG